MRARASWALALLLAGCSPQGPDPSVVTADEDRQLNDAAAFLEANALEANGVDAADADDAAEGNSQ